MQNNLVTIYADASFDRYTRAAGLSIYLRYGKNKKYQETISCICSTSVASEQRAVDYAFEIITKKLNIDLSDKIVNINIDCVAVIKAIKANNIRKKLNIKRLTIVHVKSHKFSSCPKSSINSLCDEEARKAMRELRNVILALRG